MYLPGHHHRKRASSVSAKRVSEEERMGEEEERGVQIGGRVERVDGRALSYEDFVERFMKPNRPVVLTGLMDAWRASTDWVSASNGCGLPNLAFFSDHFGRSNVQVADCYTREFTNQKRIEMSVSEFINYWLEISDKRCKDTLSCEKNGCSLLYLKDWHFIKEYPEYVAYSTPQFFTDDWLNLYLDSYFMCQGSDADGHKKEINCADYRFIYMGPKGTWTPIHADVFQSYSWSANVCGRKQWYFLSPSQSHLVFDRYSKYSVYDIFDDVSQVQFPGFKKAVWLECIQEKDEIIFVPSGWYHQVHNLEDTISINHNWFNSFNLSWVWELLLKDYNEAKEYIEDIRDICDDFEGICQRNLVANSGMNFYDFLTMITRLALANSILLYCLEYEKHAISKSSQKVKQLVSNLLSIQAVALSMKSADAFTEENLNDFLNEKYKEQACLGNILSEPELIKLSIAMTRTYSLVDEVSEQDCLMKMETISCKYGGNSFTICNPEDLVKLINHAVTDHSWICEVCSISLPSDVECC